MKSTGIVRKIDELGRIVIPKELRKSFFIKGEQDAFEIFVDDDSIILKKYQPSCVFCGNADNVVTFMGNLVCSECIAKLNDKIK